MTARSIRRTRRYAVAATVAATVASLAVAVPAEAAPAAKSAKSYPGAVPHWAVRSADTGTTAADTTVEGEVYLPLKDEAGAQALATAVSTPGSTSYGKYLSPTKWIAKYSPSRKTLHEVTSYLTASGLTISAVPKSREYVVYRGPAEAASSAFGATLHNYRFNGRSAYAPSSTPHLPASISASVAGLSMDAGKLMTKPTYVSDGSLDKAIAAAKKSTKAKVKAKSNATTVPTPAVPCSDYYGQHIVKTPAAYGKTSFPTGICGYIPAQLRSAYGVNKLINSGVDGSGQTIAITDAYASPTIVQDTNDYMRAVGSPLLTKYKQIVPAPADFKDQAACQEPSGWQEEQTLDVEAAHSVAPGAKILYVGAFNCGGGLDIALSKILDSRLATIVSNSWGDEGEAVPDDVIAGEQNQHIQAAGEGIGLYFSSGDEGDTVADTGFASPDFPASSPFVTSVGGTSLAVDAKGSYVFEAGWGDARDQILTDSTGKQTFAEPLPGDFYAGAGGGTSLVFAQPAYQKGVVPDSLALANGDGVPSRVGPDVAAVADPYTGFEIGLRPIIDDTTLETGDFSLGSIGGTSLASPVTAGQMALAQQLAGTTIGFANPTLYAVYKAAPSVFKDVTPFSPPQAVVFTSPSSGLTRLITLDRDSSLTTAKGYDDVTGLGSLNLGVLSRLASTARR